MRVRSIKYCEAEKLRKVKIQICDAIEKVAMQSGEPQLAIAMMADTTQYTISKIYNRRTEALSYNQLFFILCRLKPEFEILISV